MIALAMAGAYSAPQAAYADANCTCRANGVNFQIGEIACIRGRLSQCQMNQNNPSWQPISDICPLAEAGPDPAEPVPDQPSLPRPSLRLPG